MTITYKGGTVLVSRVIKGSARVKDSVIGGTYYFRLDLRPTWLNPMKDTVSLTVAWERGQEGKTYTVSGPKIKEDPICREQGIGWRR